MQLAVTELHLVKVLLVLILKQEAMEFCSRGCDPGTEKVKCFAFISHAPHLPRPLSLYLQL